MNVCKRLVALLLCCIMIAGCFCGTASAATLPFIDVSTSYLYYDAIHYVYENEIMYGTETTLFSPQDYLTRGMFVAILYRIAGMPYEIDPEGFTDVPEDEYYYYAVGWAQTFGIIYGVSDTLFAPDDVITKEQAIAILYRYADEYENQFYILPEESISNLPASIEEYAVESTIWAVNCGVIKESPALYNPSQLVTRGQCADYIFRFLTLAFGDGKASAIKSLSISTAEEISEIMEEMWYDASFQYDLRPIAMKFAFYNSEIIYSHSHGGSDCIVLYNDNYLYADDIDYLYMSHVDLAYISACQAGDEFAPALVETGGADAAVGFTENIRASTNKDGIHAFNRKFFEYYEQGNTMADAREKALVWIKKNCSFDTGANSMEIYYYS